MAIRRGTHGLLLALAISLCATFSGAQPAAAAGEPSGLGHFNTYAEAVATLDAAVAQHPDIARKFSIGQTHEGRQIWALELTADIANGEQGRPEVLIYGLAHARERASSEMALFTVRLLANYYDEASSLGQRIRDILGRSVVYVVPMLNADGAEYAFSNSTHTGWRKNRQPTPTTSQVGTDVDRNFGFKWACCTTGSADPSSIAYRGPAAWSAPETRALRDFVNSRVVDGRQQITEMLGLHSWGRRVMWPYSYTAQDLPAGMTTDDRAALSELARGVASRNGYTAKQRGDVAINDGTAEDWAFSEHGIFALTMDMARGNNKAYYPTLSELNTDLANNRPALLWFLEQADCPYRPAGLAEEHCAAAVIPSYSESVYSAAAAQPQQTSCWCVLASARTWLRHANPSSTVSQSELNSFVTPLDKNNWTDPSTDYYLRCTKGSPSPSFAHDGRGMAWAMWQYATPDQSVGFNDYRSTSQSDMNWQIVRSIRASGAPVGVIAAGGLHAILAVGYSTAVDPLDPGDNDIRGIRVWDPWYQTGWTAWSGWPGGGFAPNSYITINSWNGSYFKLDQNEGPYYAGNYVAILPSSVAQAPSDNPALSLGEAAWQQAQGQASTQPMELTAPASAAFANPSAPSVAAAIESGLRANQLLGDVELGNLSASYTLGRSVSVESLEGGSTYQLVELLDGGRVRAVALVTQANGAFAFGELRGVSGTFRLPTLSDLNGALARYGLDGTPRLTWGWSEEGNPRFAPFLVGRDQRSGRQTLVTPHGLRDRSAFVAEARAGN